MAIVNMNQIYKDYKQDVFHFVYKLSHNTDLSDELTQETFYYAYLAIGKFDGKSHIRTWLFAIAKNRFLMHIRKKRLKTESIDDLFDLNITDDKVQIEEDLSNKQLIKDSLEIVFSMQEKMKSVFLARLYTEETYKQIALSIGISENSAKVLFHRAKQELKKTLKEVYHYEI